MVAINCPVQNSRMLRRCRLEMAAVFDDEAVFALTTLVANVVIETKTGASCSVEYEVYSLCVRFFV